MDISPSCFRRHGRAAIMTGSRGPHCIVPPRGLSTAASLGAVGAIGMAAGARLFIFALGCTLLALFVLEVLDRAEAGFLRGRFSPEARTAVGDDDRRR